VKPRDPVKVALVTIGAVFLVLMLLVFLAWILATYGGVAF
jgi:hypothetical protein